MTNTKALIDRVAPDESKGSKQIAGKFIASILTKSFTILTGGSGTGKTALASRLAESLEKSRKRSGNSRTPFAVGDVIHGDRAQYSVASITPEILTLEKKDGSKLPLPVAVIQEWNDAWDSAKISESDSVREKREVVKDGSKFDKNAHSWESHLSAIAKSGKGFDSSNDATNHAIVPVGADWTDNRQVLGFVNHLRTAALRDAADDEKRPVYQSSPVLDLLLEATRNEDFPFFLILDEMNLSHVERYFADFLSTMEQRNGQLKLHSEGPPNDDHYRLPRFEGDPLGVPSRMVYPANLFVIGTVNVDETTYMFSPKVLDRANVIEFEVGRDSIESFLASPHEYPEPVKAEEGVAKAFLALAKKARLDPDKGGIEALSVAVSEESNEHLVVLFEILKRGRFEFAYRTANEVVRYLRVCRHLAKEESDTALAEWEEVGWKNDLDAQILQKILPKLHGSMGRVGRLLGALSAYCGGATRDGAFAYFPSGANGSGITSSGLPLQDALKPVETATPVFPKSRKKLETMIEVLLEEQFVSFIN
ncbi:MAG: hypothetical protein P1U58_19460 [Verrucomicrobiales bacterium]|nr:hypothetical protein [Verrucomicrobiales bacterium]